MDRSAGPMVQVIQPIVTLAGRPRVIIAASFAMSLFYLFHLFQRLPSEAIRTGDSDAYLTLESFRPPLYGWFLNVWQWLHGSLTGLPSVQLVMLAGLLLFAIEFGRLARNALVAAAMVPLVMAQPAIWEAPRWMMTESLYLALILLGLAMQFRHVRRGGAASLVAAAILFGLATITRNTGIVFLALPIGAALLDRRDKLFTGARRAAMSGLAALLVLLSAMGWNAARHGHFEIGSWSGISLLTKSLLLTRPDDVAGLPPPIAAVLPYAEKDRALIAAQPDLAARLRAHVQAASSDLRWGVFIPDAERSWPAWQAADWRGRGQLAGEVSKTLILRHPLGALSLWRDDWLALVLQPAYWPASMTTEMPDRSAFIACGRDGGCWALDRYDIPAQNRIVLLGVSLAGPVVALLLIGLDTNPVLRRRADPAMVLFFLASLVIHATLLMTSAFEAGGARYTVAIHVLELPLLIWVAARLGRWIQGRWGWGVPFYRLGTTRLHGAEER